MKPMVNLITRWICAAGPTGQSDGFSTTDPSLVLAHLQAFPSHTLIPVVVGA